MQGESLFEAFEKTSEKIAQMTHSTPDHASHATMSCGALEADLQPHNCRASRPPAGWDEAPAANAVHGPAAISEDQLCVAYALRSPDILKSLRPRDGRLHPANALEDRIADAIVTAAMQIDAEGGLLTDRSVGTSGAILNRLRCPQFSDVDLRRAEQLVESCYSLETAAMTEQQGRDLWARAIRRRLIPELIDELQMSANSPIVYADANRPPYGRSRVDSADRIR
jgi:hypothetical protein